MRTIVFFISGIFLFTSLQAQVTITSVTTTACSGTDNTYYATINYTIGASGLTERELILGVSEEKTSEINTTLAPGNYSIIISGLNSDGAIHSAIGSFTTPDNTPAGSTFPYMAPAPCVSNTCAEPNPTSGSETYYNSLPLQLTDANTAIPLPRFDETGGRVLTKVLISFQNTVGSSILFEELAEGTSSVKIKWTSDMYLGITNPISSGIFNTTIFNTTIISDSRTITGMQKKDVPANGAWLGDINNSFGKPSTLLRMNLIGAVSAAMENFIDPRTIPEWVTNITGNLADDNDFLYFPPIFKSDSKNIVITSGLAAYTGVGPNSIDFRAETITGLQLTGGGGNNAMIQRSKAGAKVAITYFYCKASPLAVNLIDFKAENSAEAINLTWKTENEKDFSHYEVQKSTDAKEFGSIASVNGGNSNFYSHIDRQPNIGLNYYRLKMVDLDGSFNYSKTISINFEKGASYVSIENPANYGEFLVTTNFKDPKFILLNAIGLRIDITSNVESNNIFKLKASNIVSGIYFLNILSEGKIITKKVLNN